MIKHIICLLIILITVNLLGQGNAQNVMLPTNGKVEEINGEVVRGEIKYKSEKDQGKAKINSGSFYFVAKPNETYTLSIPNYELLGDSKYFKTPDTKTYQELTKNLKCRKYKVDELVFATNIFKQNSSELQPNWETQIQEFKNFYSEQNEMKYSLTVSTSDCSFKKIVKTETIQEGKKKKKITTETSAESQAKVVLEERKAKLADILKAVKLSASVFNILEENNPQIATEKADKAPKKEKKEKKGKKKDSKQETATETSSVSNLKANLRINIFKVKN
jgi:hypothetical protein